MLWGSRVSSEPDFSPPFSSLEAALFPTGTAQLCCRAQGPPHTPYTRPLGPTGEEIQAVPRSFPLGKRQGALRAKEIPGVELWAALIPLPALGNCRCCWERENGAERGDGRRDGGMERMEGGMEKRKMGEGWRRERVDGWRRDGRRKDGRRIEDGEKMEEGWKEGGRMRGGRGGEDGGWRKDGGEEDGRRKGGRRKGGRRIEKRRMGGWEEGRGKEDGGWKKDRRRKGGGEEDGRRIEKRWRKDGKKEGWRKDGRKGRGGEEDKWRKDGWRKDGRKEGKDNGRKEKR